MGWKIQAKRLQSNKKKVGFTVRFTVRFPLVNLMGESDGRAMLIISPITSPTGGLAESVGHNKLNFIVFFSLSVFTLIFNFTKTEQTYGISELYIISHLWKQCQFSLVAIASFFILLLGNILCNMLGFRCF